MWTGIDLRKDLFGRGREEPTEIMSEKGEDKRWNQDERDRERTGRAGWKGQTAGGEAQWIPEGQKRTHAGPDREEDRD